MPSVWLLGMGCLGTFLRLAMLKIFVHAELRSVIRINSVDLNSRRCTSRPATRNSTWPKGADGLPGMFGSGVIIALRVWQG